MKDSTINKDPYIWYKDNVLSEEKCKEIINRFDESPLTGQGVTGLGLDLSVKNSTDLQISGLEEWTDIDAIFHELISKCLQDYYDHLNEKIVHEYFTTGAKLFIPPKEDVTDTGYQIQKTRPHQGYVWHQDYMTRRLITFIVYLNTVDEGWTQFANGDQISPRTGRAVMFPATWTYVHQGYPPRQTKYLMTGWLYERPDQTDESHFAPDGGL